MKDYWNDRYSDPEFAYGTEPNVFLKEQLPNLPVGNILFAAEGEGRNAVFAASMGWQVEAFDQSVEGQKKALELAALNRVIINYEVGEFSEVNYSFNQFDVAALIFAHFNSDKKKSYHTLISKYVKPGGYILFEAFSTNHIKYNQKNINSGGPSNVDMLFSKREVEELFPDFEIVILDEVTYTLREGKYHDGEGSVIRYLGKKISTVIDLDVQLIY